jgi:hypothetical protein
MRQNWSVFSQEHTREGLQLALRGNSTELSAIFGRTMDQSRRAAPTRPFTKLFYSQQRRGVIYDYGLNAGSQSFDTYDSRRFERYVAPPTIRMD